MRAKTPTIHCDADDGLCGDLTVDYYEQTASTVGGTRITRTVRAPGWVSTDLQDLCPKHAPEAPR